VTHGQRFVLNYANAKAANYGKYEKAGKMATGAVTAKNSFTVNAKGQTVGTTNGKGKGIGQILSRVPQFGGRGSGYDDVPARGNTRQLTPHLI
jgi:hypothetical protein